MAADNVEIEKLRGEEKDKLKIIERETSELEKLRLEKSAKRAEIDEKVGKYKFILSRKLVNRISFLQSWLDNFNSGNKSISCTFL